MNFAMVLYISEIILSEYIFIDALFKKYDMKLIL